MRDPGSTPFMYFGVLLFNLMQSLHPKRCVDLRGDKDLVCRKLSEAFKEPREGPGLFLGGASGDR